MVDWIFIAYKSETSKKRIKEGKVIIINIVKIVYLFNIFCIDFNYNKINLKL
jgi:hypothetical protein